MTADEFKQARAKLPGKRPGKPITNYALGLALGVTPRQSRRYESGESPISKTVQLLLHMYLRHGIPKRLVRRQNQA